MSEEVVTPDLLGRVDDPNERAELTHFKKPTANQIQKQNRVWALCEWVDRINRAEERNVQPHEVIAEAVRRFNVSEEQAEVLSANVTRAFARKKRLHF